MVRLDDSGQRRRRRRDRDAVRRRDGKPRYGSASSVIRGGVQSTSLGELVEQRRLIEASHHNDPIDDATLSPEADPTIRGADQRSDLEIEVRSRAAVERELGLAG